MKFIKNNIFISNLFYLSFNKCIQLDYNNVVSFNKCIQLDYNNVAAWNNKGYTLLHLGLYTKALKA